MKTFFILGAGANVDIGMPTGLHLKSTICSLFETREPLFKAKISCIGTSASDFQLYLNTLYRRNNYISEITNAGTAIINGLPLELSIDDFLYKHFDNKYLVSCGKLSIVFAILNYERNSKMYTDSYVFPINNINTSWYIQLYQKIAGGCKLSTLIKRLEEITFIIFNYDRCFERFFCNAIMINYCISYQEAQEIVNGMNIFHPYGNLGSCKFGATVNHDELIEVSNNIKIYTEKPDEKTELLYRYFAFNKNPYNVIFLGFAYHNQNMKILFKEKNDNTVIKHLYGTGLGISDNDIKYLENYWSSSIGGLTYFKILDMDCLRFFKELQYTLSFTD